MRSTHLPVLLLVVVACADPEDPDAGATDIGFADSGVSDSGVARDAAPDTGPTDQGVELDGDLPDTSPDAAVFSISLASSLGRVTEAASVTLTATPLNGAGETIDFYEGTILLGSAAAPGPFGHQLDFTAAANGTHTYHAEAGPVGQRTISNEVVVVVEIATGLYVDPVGGDDANVGTMAEPLRTIAQASSQAMAGDTIWLLDGTYDVSNQGPNFGAVCPGPFLPTDVNLRAVNPNAVTLEGPQCAYRVDGSSRIEGLHFFGYQQALEFYAGSSTVADTRFEDCGMAMYLRDTAEVLLLAPAAPLITDVQNLAFGVPGATVDGNARLTVRNALIQDILTFNIGVFLARGAGTLIIEGSTFQRIDRSAFRVYDNAHAVVRDTTFDAVGGAGLSAEHATILIGGSNTQNPLDLGVTLERCTMLNNHGHGIAIAYYSNFPTHLGVTLVDTRIQDGFGTAIFNNGLTTADPGLDVAILLRNTTLLGGARGIISVIGNIDIEGGEISGMTGPGIEITASNSPNTLRARGVTFDGDGDDAVRISSPTTVVDLGTAADPGNNLMSAIPANASAVSVLTPIRVDAVGNTWMANEQGADATGHYPASTTIAGPANGRNYELSAGASLVIEP